MSKPLTRLQQGVDGGVTDGNDLVVHLHKNACGGSQDEQKSVQSALSDS